LSWLYLLFLPILNRDLIFLGVHWLMLVLWTCCGSTNSL
jgi:hypothetical protein